ncbi:hypothetical protein [Klebsiella variicola]|uniref:hypothetical protein n=1 Tax=Klebsiella variicola TaxID=244366 RepID=UPI0011EC7DCB|nr:hypothetical protein [Klebsiella variicola]KAA0473412.1 hypothetical protein F0331_06445 [Klebsiella variicola]
MADVYGIQNTLVGIIAGIAYPSGTSQPSITGVDMFIYAGWPQSERLERDLKAGKLHVSVYPLSTEKKLTEALGRPWRTISKGVSGISAVVSGQQVTFSGTVTTPTNINIYADKQHHVYAVQSGSTLTQIATALAALIPGATSSGPVVTMPATSEFEVRVGTVDTVGRILRRQEKDFQVTIWAGTPALRATAASAIDNDLSSRTSLDTTDGSPTLIKYKRSIPSDNAQSYLVYRHDMIFTVDFSSMQTAEATQVVAPTMNVRDTSDNLIKSFPE